MSLEQKLSFLTRDIEEKKIQEAKEAEEKELGPIRSKIKELEDKKHFLELIKGSLSLKSGEILEHNKYTGIGMTEYSSKTNENLEKEIKKLDNLIIKHKEALENLDINSREELVDKFKDDEDSIEVQDYLGAKDKKEELNKSDDILQERLKKFDIDVNKENFSYSSTEKKIDEKLGVLDDALFQEKIKTPEGREEAIKNLSTELEKILPDTELSKNNFNNYDFSFSNSQTNKIHIINEEAKMDEGRYIYLLPDFFHFPDNKELKKMESRYGADIIKESIKTAYLNKTEKTFEEFSKSSNKDYFDNKNLRTETIKSNISKKIDQLIDFSLKMKEINREVVDQKFCQNYTYLEGEFRKIEENKKDALELIGQITKIESELPNEEVILEGKTIKVPSFIKNFEKLKEDLISENKNLDDKKTEIKGRVKGFWESEEKWKKAVSELEKEYDVLEGKIDKMRKEDYINLHDKSYINIPSKEYSDTENILKAEHQKGKPSEIFNELMEKLSGVIDKKSPESIVRLYKEYKEMEDKLYS